MSDDRMRLVLKRGAALGNGDRPAGFCLGSTTAEDFDSIGLENTELAEGVTPQELANACRNPLLLDLNVKLQLVACGADDVPPEEVDGEGADDAGDAAGVLVAAEPWRELPIDQVPGVTASLAKPFIAAGLVTLGQVWDWGEEHKGLRGIAGVGAATESALCEAIGKYLDSLVPGDDEEADEPGAAEPPEEEPGLEEAAEPPSATEEGDAD